MKEPLGAVAFNQLFVEARSFNRYTPRPVADDTLRELYELLKWGPTAVNSQPARYVFVRTAEGKERLLPTLFSGNVEKVRHAPVTVIVATDRRFFDHLPEQFLGFDAKPMFAGNPALADETAVQNGALQGAYLMMAARAMGLDCRPMSGFDKTALDAAFFPDGRWKANLIITLGYGDPAHNPRRGPRLSIETAARFA